VYRVQRRQTRRLLFIALYICAIFSALDDNIHTLVKRLLDESHLGKIIQKAVQAAGGANEIVDRYLHDFVRMTYKTQTEYANEEFQVCLLY
jgi:hypothetical protein